jgi:ABC-type transport system involved in multi-copper enzyme maturation permease subunit
VNARAVRAIIRKDLTVLRRSRATSIPLVAFPVVVLVIVPVVLAVVPALAPAGPAGLQFMLSRLPPQVFRGLNLQGLTAPQAWVVLVNAQLWPPLFLLVPYMVANVIAADSFAGERERKTLEALLYTPPTDAELFLAKVLTAWLPAMAVSLFGFVAYALVANVAAWPVMGRIFFPNLTWLVLVSWVAPAFAALGMAAMVLISMRVNGTHEAIQLGGLLVLPLVALIVGQIKGIVLLGPTVMLVLGAVVWLIDAVLLRYGVRSFRRTRLVSRL